MLTQPSPAQPSPAQVGAGGKSGALDGIHYFQHPDLNGVARTSLIPAEATWAPPCEWLFYTLLPLLALTTNSGKKPRFHWPAWPWLALATLTLISPLGLSGRFLTAFAGVCRLLSCNAAVWFGPERHHPGLMWSCLRAWQRWRWRCVMTLLIARHYWRC